MSQGSDKPSDAIISWWSQNDVLFMVYRFISLHCQYWLLVLNCFCRLCQGQFFLFNFLSLSDWMMESHRVVHFKCYIQLIIVCVYFWNLFVYISFSFRGPCVRKLLNGLIMYIYPLKIKNIVLYCIESVDEILSCDHSNESYWAVLSCGTVFIMLYKVVLTFESVDEILSCDHSNESSLPVFSHGTICFSTFHKMKFGNFVEIWFWPL